MAGNKLHAGVGESLKSHRSLLTLPGGNPIMNSHYPASYRPLYVLPRPYAPTWQQQRRQLVAERLSCPGGQDGEKRVALEHRPDHLELMCGAGWEVGCGTVCEGSDRLVPKVKWKARQAHQDPQAKR